MKNLRHPPIFSPHSKHTLTHTYTGNICSCYIVVLRQESCLSKRCEFLEPITELFKVKSKQSCFNFAARLKFGIRISLTVPSQRMRRKRKAVKTRCVGNINRGLVEKLYWIVLVYFSSHYELV